MASDYKPGDTITLVKGEDRLVREVLAGDTVKVVTSHPDLVAGIAVLVADGWRITDLTPNPAPLPTEPGIYVIEPHGNVGEEPWGTDGFEFYYLNSFGNWADAGFGAPPEDAPLVKLVQEAKREAVRVIEHHLGIDFGWCNPAAMNEDDIKAAVKRASDELGVSDGE